MEEILFPAWLDEFKVADKVRATAYEKAGNDKRALIKTAIAFHNTLHDNNIKYKKTIVEKGAFLITEELKPFPMCICVIGKDFNSPAMFIANLMPVLLAQVSSLCLLFEVEPQEELLACAELMGIENVFYIPEEQQTQKHSIEKLLIQTKILYNYVNLMLLGKNETLMAVAKEKKITTFIETRQITIYINNENSKEYENFLFAHPKAEYVHNISSPNTFYDIASMKDIKENLQNNLHALLLDTGCECCYLASCAKRDFYIKQQSIKFVKT